MLSVESDRMARCVASQAVDAPPCTKPPAASYYKQLVDDIETIGWESLISLNEALNVLEVQIADQQGRNHSLRVEFASDYPSTCPLLAVDAPCEFYPPWESTAWNLKGIIDHFRSNFLPQFSAFWDVMDDLDAHCIILEPSRPQRSMTHRRIAIEKHISIDIEILDPLRPFSICKLEFFGKETSIECFRRRWSENISSWDDSGHTLLRSNLESILGLCFPGPLMESIGDFQLECGICYCFHLVENGIEMLPDRLCDNPTCSRRYHERCLLEWLRALPAVKRLRRTLIGECPHCGETMYSTNLSRQRRQRRT